MRGAGAPCQSAGAHRCCMTHFTIDFASLACVHSTQAAGAFTLGEFAQVEGVSDRSTNAWNASTINALRSRDQHATRTGVRQGRERTRRDGSICEANETGRAPEDAPCLNLRIARLSLRPYQTFQRRPARI